MQSAALSRVTLVGQIVPLTSEELPALKTAYSIVHSYSERLVESPKFYFCKVRAAHHAYTPQPHGACLHKSTWADLPCPFLSSHVQLQPQAVYFVGGFGVMSKWIPVDEYEVRAPCHGVVMKQA